MLSSIAKIHKENLKKSREDIEAKVRKESGVDDVEPLSPGAGTSIDRMTPREKIEAGLKKNK